MLFLFGSSLERLLHLFSTKTWWSMISPLSRLVVVFHLNVTTSPGSWANCAQQQANRCRGEVLAFRWIFRQNILLRSFGWILRQDILLRRRRFRGRRCWTTCQFDSARLQANTVSTWNRSYASLKVWQHTVWHDDVRRYGANLLLLRYPPESINSLSILMSPNKDFDRPTENAMAVIL